MERNQIVIGLLGFGCVGKGLYDVLERTPGMRARIKHICVKDRNKPRTIPMERFTFDADTILNDSEVNVVVELIDDAEAALRYVRQAMRNGKHVVSANKKMIAENFTELRELQIQYGVSFLYEASCCASIPIIRNLEEYYDNDLLESVSGIVNGSTNYILTESRKNGSSFTEALQSAQQMGYAESNPALDVEGFDSRYKLCILIAHAFGIECNPEEILKVGIQNVCATTLQYASEKGFRIRLVAEAEKNSFDEVFSCVIPTFVNPANKLFHVDDVFNGIATKTSFADEQFFVGKGAGAFPTASAVLSDISALSYDYRYEYKKIHQTTQSTLNSSGSLHIYCACKTNEVQDIIPRFTRISEQFNSHHTAYLIGTISTANLYLLTQEFPTASIVRMPHPF